MNFDCFLPMFAFVSPKNPSNTKYVPTRYQPNQLMVDLSSPQTLWESSLLLLVKSVWASRWLQISLRENWNLSLLQFVCSTSSQNAHHAWRRERSWSEYTSWLGQITFYVDQISSEFGTRLKAPDLQSPGLLDFISAPRDYSDDTCPNKSHQRGKHYYSWTDSSLQVDPTPGLHQLWNCSVKGLTPAGVVRWWSHDGRVQNISKLCCLGCYCEMKWQLQ